MSIFIAGVIGAGIVLFAMGAATAIFYLIRHKGPKDLKHTRCIWVKSDPKRFNYESYSIINLRKPQQLGEMFFAKKECSVCGKVKYCFPDIKDNRTVFKYYEVTEDTAKEYWSKVSIS